MLKQIQWHQANAENNPFGYLNPARWYIHWWNGRKMDAYIGTELDKRYREMLADAANTRHKAIIDLVLQASPDLSSSKNDTLDAAFRSFAIRQIRLFLFVGHDSSSSAICYSLYLLSKDSRAYELLCKEHDRVFGSDPLATPSQLEKNPHLINALPYTLAVIKETLRMFPPAAGIRQGKRGVCIRDDKGNLCPTDDTMLLTVHVELHRSQQNWVRPEEFLPERWLVEPGHELYPLKGAWRPFEHGPRNCVAQSLVLTELRIVLACVVRRFRIQPAYEEWDALHPRKGLKEFRGERVYQIEEGAAHPVERYPCRVSFRSR